MVWKLQCYKNLEISKATPSRDDFFFNLKNTLLYIGMKLFQSVLIKIFFENWFWRLENWAPQTIITQSFPFHYKIKRLSIAKPINKWILWVVNIQDTGFQNARGLEGKEK